MAVVLGKNLFIYSGTSATGTTPVIAAAKSCTISMKAETMEVASPTAQTAKNKQFIAGRTEWEVSINHLVAVGNEFQGILKVGTDFDISVVVAGVRKTGHVICTQADISGAKGSIATGSVKLKGTGALG